ncbi:MAG: hypothetical protein NUV56_01670 [Candidatus Uhrbacteria bacterium]|nr:hypothetical protein [Candidatus Uhrbacteria bacterium]
MEFKEVGRWNRSKRKLKKEMVLTLIFCGGTFVLSVAGLAMIVFLSELGMKIPVWVALAAGGSAAAIPFVVMLIVSYNWKRNS